MKKQAKGNEAWVTDFFLKAAIYVEYSRPPPLKYEVYYGIRDIVFSSCYSFREAIYMVSQRARQQRYFSWSINKSWFFLIPFLKYKGSPRTHNIRLEGPATVISQETELDTSSPKSQQPKATSSGMIWQEKTELRVLLLLLCTQQEPPSTALGKWILFLL